MIAKQDLKGLRNLPIHTYNLNFIIEDQEIQFYKKITPLLSACYVGKVDTIFILLGNDNLDVNQESIPEGYTPLMVSCFKGYYEIVKLLLERKADVSKPNTAGQVPILFCFSRLEESYYKYENKKICMMMIDLLLSKGADINITLEGKTILMKLISADNTLQDKDKCNNTCEIIKFLIERGADKNLPDKSGMTVFDIISDGPFKKNILNTIRETERIIFYTEDEDHEKSTILENVERSSLCCYIF
jgi:ankyrin repeat protein